MNTINIKTSELSGAALDWAVAKCEGKDTCMYYGVLHQIMPCLMGGTYIENPINYSSDWALAGPIIEREKMQLYPVGNFGWCSTPSDGLKQNLGNTPLIAAMRCYVASKFGDSVNVPAELV